MRNWEKEPKYFKLTEIKKGGRRWGGGRESKGKAGRGKREKGKGDKPPHNGSEFNKKERGGTEAGGRGLLMHLVNVLALVRRRSGPMWRTAWSTVGPSGRALLCWSCTAWRCCLPEGQQGCNL